MDVVLLWNESSQAMPRAKVIQTIASFWHLQHQKNVPVSYESAPTRKHWKLLKQEAQKKLYLTQMASSLQLRQVELALKNFGKVFSKVTTALDQVFRSSSPVEALNSHIRICQQVKKRFSANFLALVTLYWNMRPFRQRKRQGKSPFQILGIQGDNENWLDFLLSNH